MMMPDSEDESEEDEFMVDGPTPFENSGADDADEEQEDEDEENEEEEEGGEAEEEDDQGAKVPVAEDAELQQTAPKKRKAETLTTYSETGSEDEKEDETLNQPNDFSRSPMSAASLGLKTTPPDVVAEEDAAQLPAREQQANASGAQKGEEAPSGRGKKGAAQSNGVFVPAVVEPALRELFFVLPSKGQWTRVPMEDCLHAVACDDEGKLIQPLEVDWTDLEATKKDQKELQTKITDANATYCLRSLLIFDMPIVERQSAQTQNKSNKMACLPVKIKPPADEAHREALQKFEELCASTGVHANILWVLDHSIVKRLYKLYNNGLPSDFDPYKQASINYVNPNSPHKLCEINPKWTLFATNGKEAGGKTGKAGSGRGRGGGGAKKQRKAPEASSSAPATDKLDDANGSQQLVKTVQEKLPFTAPEAGKAALAQTKRRNKQVREAEGIVSTPHSSTKTTASQIQLNFTKSAQPAAATTDVSDTSGEMSVETAIAETQPNSSEEDEDERRYGDKNPIADPQLMKIQNEIRPYTTGLELLDSANNSLCRTHVFKLFNDKQKLASASICGNYLYVTVTEDPDDRS